jgi:hypothetical protein
MNPGLKVDMTDTDAIMAYVRHLGTEKCDIIGLSGQQRKMKKENWVGNNIYWS